MKYILRCVFLITILLMYCNKGISGDSIYVDASVSVSGDGSSWAQAKKSIQEALNIHTTNDPIFVAEGTYYPSQGPSGPTNSDPKNYTFYFKEGTQIYGGFPTGGGIRNVNLHETILDGNAPSGQVYHVVLGLSPYPRASINIDGFTIKNGNANGGPGHIDVDGHLVNKDAGGGIYCSSSYLIISNCKIIDNNADSEGGGVYSNSNNPTIQKSVISNNQASVGGGIYAFCPTRGIRFYDNFIMNNMVDGLSLGGGVYVELGDSWPLLLVTFYNNVFVQNESDGGQGGNLYVKGGQANVSYNTFYLDGSQTSSTGEHFYSDLVGYTYGDHHLRSNIFKGSNDAIYPNTLSIERCIVENGYSACEGCPNGNGNVNPKFINSNDADGVDDIYATLDDGFNITKYSPAIDFDIIYDWPPHDDILGNNKVGHRDIGAYEFICYDDTFNPVCQDINVYLDNTGNVTIDPLDFDGGDIYACAPLILVPSKTAFDCNDLGINQVEVTITSAKDSTITATCLANVNVIDNITPYIGTYGNKTYFLNPDCNYIMPNFLDSITKYDNCSSFTIDQYPTPGTIITGPGDVQVFIKIDDASGNTSDEEFFNVRLFNNAQPTAVCKDFTIYLDEGGVANIDYNDIDGGSSWSCGVAEIYIDQQGVECYQANTTQAVTMFITLGANDDQCTAMVTILDTLPPVFSNCGGTELLFPGAVQSFDPNELGISATDNCTFDPAFTFDPPTYGCGNLPTQVTVTATDASGNQSQCIIGLMYDDYDPPIAVCKNATIHLNEQAQAILQPSDIDGGSTDDCSIVTMNLSRTEFGCADVGQTFTVILTVIDGGGNSDNCTANVTIQDGQFNGQRKVMTTQDSGLGSLRDLIVDACDDDNIFFDNSLMDETIRLLGQPLLLGNKNLSINGLGMDHLYISGENNSRVFQLNSGQTASLKNLNVINGYSIGNGGGALNNKGILSVENVRFSNNRATSSPMAIKNESGGKISILGNVIIED